MDPPRSQSLPVLIASTLCFIWGAIMLGLGIVVLVAIFSRRGFALGAALFPFIVLIIAATYCVLGYLIARRRRFGAWLGVGVATLTALLQLVMHLDIMRISLTPCWLAVDALLLVLLLSNWRRFDQAGPRVAA